jgi:hypothetical protein
VDADCDCCTPLYRTEQESSNGYETLVNWVGTVAPPPPGTNLDPQRNQSIIIASPAGNRRALIQWDNLSELSADPAQDPLHGVPDLARRGMESTDRFDGPLAR